jgi:hypothetical protein
MLRNCLFSPKDPACVEDFLVMAAYQLAECTRYQTVDREPFEGGTIEDYMAYLQRHNLRFAPASPAHRSAYHRVFTMMVR